MPDVVEQLGHLLDALRIGTTIGTSDLVSSSVSMMKSHAQQRYAFSIIREKIELMLG